MAGQEQQFIEFALERGVLRFGEFTLKSGRKSPYFFNAGLFNTGAALAALGRFYARAIVDSGIRFDVLFGPAYKGIPLAAVTALALSEHHALDVPYAFNRKEAKDHGEGGTIVGAPLAGRGLIIDDVITAGTAIGEAVDVIRAQGAEPVGVVICLDRQERGAGEASAIDEVKQRHGLAVVTVATLADLVANLADKPELADSLAALERYRGAYGIR